MKKHRLFIAIGIGLLTASAASAQDFTVLGTVSNDSDPGVFQPEQFDVSDFFPETNSASVTFDFKNDTPPLPGPGDDPNSLTFSSDLTVSEISVARLDGEFQFRFQYVEGADTNHLRDVQLNLDGGIFRDQFADFNDHLGSAALGTARMGAGLAVNALGLVGPEAQIYLIAFSLVGSILDDVLPDFSFTADDLAQLSVDFSPCDAGGCDVNTLGDFNFDEFNLEFAGCDGGGCDALFETAESILETAFDCTGSACSQRDMAYLEVPPDVMSAWGEMSEAEAQQISTEFTQALERYLQDQIQRDLNVGREMDVEVPRDAFAAWTEGRFGPINEQTGPTDEQYEAMLAFEQLEGREAPSLDLRETTLLSPSGFTGASVFTEMFLMILDQDQQDMNIESVMPELADMVVL